MFKKKSKTDEEMPPKKGSKPFPPPKGKAKGKGKSKPPVKRAC